MAVTYTVQISDADFRALCWKAENPHQYVDDRVTFFIHEMKKDFVKDLIKSEIESPVTRSISADVEQLLSQTVIKTAKQRDLEETERMKRFVANPDDPTAQTDSSGPSFYIP